MANWKKLASGAAGAAGGAGGLNVENVFSTYKYEGNSGTAQSITNGIDLSTEGGFVWIKQMTQNNYHYLFDTEATGNTSALLLPLTTGASAVTTALTSFNSDGFSLGSNSGVNGTHDMVSWTWRKAPKFFDIVTYTGNGTSQNISHNLGSVPGSIIVKKTNASKDWAVYHRSVGNGKRLLLHQTNGALSGNHWNYTTPTASVFSVGGDGDVNQSGDSYVAYLFAHNDGDGDFGPTGDQDIIKCGSYTGTGSSDGFEIDLGFEPQWVLVKRSDAFASWQLMDNIRGIVSGYNDLVLSSDSTDTSQAAQRIRLLPNGFFVESNNSNINASNGTYIYVAIRRGPMAIPESSDGFYQSTIWSSGSDPSFSANFPVDFAFWKTTPVSSDFYASSRLSQGQRLRLNTSGAETSQSGHTFDYMDGWLNLGALSSSYQSWMFKRAPNFFDLVTFKGTSSSASHTVNHNLGIAPDMVWIKRRDSSGSWNVYHNDGSTERKAFLETNLQGFSNNMLSSIGDTSFVVNGGILDPANYLICVFGSLSGITKMGSYTGNGTSQNIDCGFSNGASFVIIKRVDSTGDWELYDTERGINSSNDSHLKINTGDASFNSADTIDPYSAGFGVNKDGSDDRSNANGATYIFYAIAA